MLKHVPNALTIARFILIPFILTSLINNNYLLISKFNLHFLLINSS